MSALELFAEELKKKRETQGLSISDLYDITRIDKAYLEDMEKGNFEIMPAVYMRAFIRKYADAVELNPNEAIAKYEAAQSGKSFDKVASITENEVNKVEPNTEYSEPKARQTQIKESNNNPFIIVGGIVLFLVIGFSYLLFFSSNSEEIIVEKRVEDIINERTHERDNARFKAKTDESETILNSDGSTTDDTFSLKINALDTVWFRTEIDNASKDEFILNPNGSKTLRAKSQINILIGNTGGIEFSLNGKKIDFKGKKGKTRNITIKADGIHYSN